LFVILFLGFLCFPRERFSLQDAFAQVGKGCSLSFIPQHGQKVGQLPQSFWMHQIPLNAPVQIVQR